jgi:PiT family inorganic phosphate transporter
MLVATIVFVGFLLAYANGANDNFKGVATLVGSGTTGYRRALLWATLTTALGSMAAFVLARGLIEAFQGKGLVPEDVAGNSLFPAAVGLAAGLTVLLATRLGFPISTTHALIGALVGAGLVVSPEGVNGARLVSAFLLPLLTSPFVAVASAMALYPLLSSARKRLGVSQETCVCLGDDILAVLPVPVGASQALRSVPMPTLAGGTDETCRVRYRGSFLGIQARPLLDALHYLSAGAVSFARGVNDTPKIAALLLVGGMVAPETSLIGVGAAMAIGGLISARRVAETMSHRVTEMNAGQGFTANFVTAGLVIGASWLGMPVSTTHVSCGSLFGIGAVTGRGNWGVIGQIVGAWVITLPVAGMLGALFANCLPRLAGVF